MTWVMGDVIGEGEVGGNELNVRKSDGKMLWTRKVRVGPLT